MFHDKNRTNRPVNVVLEFSSILAAARASRMLGQKKCPQEGLSEKHRHDPQFERPGPAIGDRGGRQHDPQRDMDPCLDHDATTIAGNEAGPSAVENVAHRRAPIGNARQIDGVGPGIAWAWLGELGVVVGVLRVAMVGKMEIAEIARWK